ncbi:hypothetical protein COCC4DRAFT_143656 [Bipolaris maydis ATCC 48331]|uniref:Uncharacterized protein n=2 Tax=Cochliobolus heterostrophus TaxID=5016 RepID=M2TXX3_COCH5|nr:uncharacterized protein COCC4DRAFT_143656 [Bipolaris maydis ATCC 48331]EMD86571.1 hypothetical protein COCHEDRAFT_1218158 [Bipolaris maydis C5]ENI02986.1 hypothetical protein COCC4DRAFT_143656 [Bipolaris maydis ATCC 48331]KAJ6267503.1 hypothetical protein PSV08DRAFT_355067 [Bipolaris maydis]
MNPCQHSSKKDVQQRAGVKLRSLAAVQSSIGATLKNSMITLMVMTPKQCQRFGGFNLKVTVPQSYIPCHSHVTVHYGATLIVEQSPTMLTDEHEDQSGYRKMANQDVLNYPVERKYS